MHTEMFSNLSGRPVQQPGHKAHAACKRPQFDTSKTSVTVRCLWEKNWSLLPRGKASHWTGETGVIILLSQNEVNTRLDFAGLFAVRCGKGSDTTKQMSGETPKPIQTRCRYSATQTSVMAKRMRKKSNALVTTRLIQVVREQDKSSRSGVHVMLF